ncbi:hypothetical protein DH2020_009530 [Rehmannia glutinosa]|uniref:J domain-containing protein n=1 Tax=Rehmannia glutinosa TaxID=99300 RepID=A0ABR0X6K7_REHGL
MDGKHNNTYKDYYKVLEVDYDATDEKIRLNYRKLALKWHPDKHKGDSAVTAKFQEINEAYTVLSDPDKRLDYDLSGNYEIDKYTLREDDDDSSNKWPVWVRALLETSFFGQCKVHAASHKNECNMFCLDCVNQPFCSICLTLHKDHRPIQIRRSSYHDVIRVCEIQKYLDITGVQTYVINSAKIVFLNHRPQPRPSAKGLTNNCRVCHRTLLHNFNFCSLGCKIVGTSNNNLEKQHIGMEVGDSEWMNGTRHNMIIKNKIQSFSPSTPPQTSMMISTKRRKGIPHRAPT